VHVSPAVTSLPDAPAVRPTAPCGRGRGEHRGQMPALVTLPGCGRSRPSLPGAVAFAVCRLPSREAA